MPLVVDLDRPIGDVETGGASSLFVTATAAGRVVGSAWIPVSSDPVPSVELAYELERRFGSRSEMARLERSLVPEQPASLPSATVAVCTCGRPESLRRCLNSLRALRAVSIGLLVVDNGREPDPDVQCAASEVGARYTHEPVTGLSRARNRAIAETSTEVLLFTDDDAAVAPEWAVRLLEPFRDPLVMASAGLVVPASLTTAAQVAFERHAGFSRGHNRRVFDGTIDSAFRAPAVGAGASIAFRTVFLRSTGGFAEELGPGMATGAGDDHEMLVRVLSAGFRAVYEPSSLAFHWHRDDLAAVRTVMRSYGASTVALLLHRFVHARDVAALVDGARFPGGYYARRAARTLLRRPHSVPPSLLLAELAGLAAGPSRYLASRRAIATRTPVFGPSGTPRAAEGADPAPVRVTREVPSLTVVIPSRGRREMLLGLLRHLERQAYPTGSVEIVVSLDGDIDGSMAAVRESTFGVPVDSVVLESPSRDPAHGNGPGPARNHGAARAAGHVLLFLDDDVLPSSNELLLAHAAGATTGAGGTTAGRVAVGPCTPAISDTSRFFPQLIRNWAVDHLTLLRSTSRLDFSAVSTGNVSMPRQVFVDVGGFRPLPRREDWELGYRLGRLGLPVTLVEAAAVSHQADVDVANAIDDRWREGAGDATFATMHPEMLAWLPLARFDCLVAAHPVAMAAVLREYRVISSIRRAGMAMLDVLEFARQREGYHALLSHLNVLAYWSGVAAGVGGRRGWEQLRAAAHGGSPRVAEFDIDAPSWDPPAAGIADHVEVYRSGRLVGRAPVYWGGVPWSEQRFRREVAARLAVELLTAPRAVTPLRASQGAS